MQITRIYKHGATVQTTVPADIRRALKVAPPDYIVWTWHSDGHAEIRRVPQPHEIAAAAAKKR